MSRNPGFDSAQPSHGGGSWWEPLFSLLMERFLSLLKGHRNYPASATHSDTLPRYAADPNRFASAIFSWPDSNPEPAFHDKTHLPHAQTSLHRPTSPATVYWYGLTPNHFDVATADRADAGYCPCKTTHHNISSTQTPNTPASDTIAG